MTTFRYSTGLLSVAPSERKQVSVALPICLPLQQYLRRSFVAASRYLVKVKFWCVACSTVPEPAALRVGLVGWTKPWLHDSTSISPVCSEAVVEVTMFGVSNLRYMFVAMVQSPYAAAGGGSSATSRIDVVSSSSWKCGRRKATAR